MSEKLFITIPTKGRWNNIITNVDNQILIVDKNEANLYKEFNPNSEIEVCPNFNNLALKRNWILDRFGDVFMLDDDVIDFMDLTKNSEEVFLNSKKAYEKIIWLYEKAIDLDIFLFGFNNSPQLVHYNAMKPLMFKGFINGSAIGIRKNEKLRFTEKTIAVEDYYINLLNAYIFRKNLIDKRFCFKQKDKSTFIQKGGQSKNRTLQTEKKDTLFLRLMFGESIIIKKERNLKEKSSQYQRQLNIKL